MSRSFRLDIVRSLAILAVIAVHTVQVVRDTVVDLRPASNFEIIFVEILSLGKYGVELFFALSGVLLGKIYSNSQAFKLSDFAQNRIRRIYPLWMIFGILSLFLYLAFDRGWWKGLVNVAEQNGTPSFMVAIATFLFSSWLLFSETTHRAIAGGWSIEAEVAHYFIFPIGRLFTPARLVAAVSVCGVLQATLTLWSESNVTFIDQVSKALLSLSVFSTAPFFFFGLLAASYTSVKAVKGLLNPNLRNLSLLLLFSPGILLWLGARVPFGWVGEAVVVVVCLIVLAHFITLRAERSRRIWETISRHSYSMYFTHFWLVSIYVAFDLQVRGSDWWSNLVGNVIFLPLVWFALFGSVSVISYFVGFPIYRFIERPAMQLRRN